MRFRIGPPPEDDTISREESSWNLVNEPNPLNLQIIGILVAVFIAICIGVIISLSVGIKHVLGLSWPMVMLFIFLIMPIHELLHAVGFEGGVISRQVVFGLYPKGFGFYAHYNGQIPRSRYIIVAALPFLILTAIPITIVAGFRLDHKYLTEIIFANGLVSAVDVLTIILILKETPQHSALINSGMKTYWKSVANRVGGSS